jgi:hypothetical protein
MSGKRGTWLTMVMLQDFISDKASYRRSYRRAAVYPQSNWGFEDPKKLQANRTRHRQLCPAWKHGVLTSANTRTTGTNHQNGKWENSKHLFEDVIILAGNSFAAPEHIQTTAPANYPSGRFSKRLLSKILSFSPLPVHVSLQSTSFETGTRCL